MNPDWDGRMKAAARKPKKNPTGPPLLTVEDSRVRILRIALEAIYTQPYLTLAEARQLAGRALEDTE